MKDDFYAMLKIGFTGLYAFLKHPHLNLLSAFYCVSILCTIHIVLMSDNVGFSGRQTAVFNVFCKFAVTILSNSGLLLPGCDVLYSVKKTFSNDLHSTGLDSSEWASIKET